MEHPGTHGKPSVLPLLKKINLEQNNSGKSLNQMLEDGDIDAMTTASIPKPFGTNPDIQRLFPNFREIEADYYQRTKIFPIMHVLAIKRSTYEKNPFIATSLYNACYEARAMAVAKMRDVGALRFMLPWLVADFHEIDQTFGNAFWPYGVRREPADARSAHDLPARAGHDPAHDPDRGYFRPDIRLLRSIGDDQERPRRLDHARPPLAVEPRSSAMKEATISSMSRSASMPSASGRVRPTMRGAGLSRSARSRDRAPSGSAARMERHRRAPMPRSSRPRSR